MIVKIKRFVYPVLIFVSFLLRPEIAKSVNINNYLVASYFTIITIGLFFHFIGVKEKNFFRIDTIFLMGFIIVHFQWPLMLIYGKVEPSMFRALNLFSNYITYGTWLSLIGLLAWMWGFSWISTKSSLKQKIKEVKVIWNRKILMKLNIVIFILFIGFAGRKFLTAEIYRVSGSADPISGIAGYIHTIVIILVILWTIEVFMRTKRVVKPFSFIKANKIYSIYFLIFSIVFAMAGDRSSILIVTCSLLLFYGYFIKPISLKNFSFLVLSGALLFSLISLTRARGIGGINQYNISSNYDLTLNLANSARTLYLGIDDVVFKDRLHYGKLWIGNILGVIPFAQGTYVNLTNTPPYLLNSANYITYIRYGPNATTGEGTSLIVDIFLNFGEFGVLFFLFLFGVLMGKAQNSLIFKENFYWLVIAAFIGGTAFYVGRSTMLNPLKMIVWGILISEFFVKKKFIGLRINKGFLTKKWKHSKYTNRHSQL